MTEHENDRRHKREEQSIRPLFALGQIVATPGAIEVCGGAETLLVDYLKRHVCGDWGDLDKDDKRANQRALVVGSRLFSAYNLPDGTRLWIITEADRSVTTALLPEEY